MAKPAKTETALVPYAKGTAVANLTDLADKARGYAERAQSEGTRRLYQDCWSKYQTWCDAHGDVECSPCNGRGCPHCRDSGRVMMMRALPAAPGTLAAYFTWLAEGQPGDRNRGFHCKEGDVVSNSRMNTMWSAINHFHKKAGFPLSSMMRDAAKSSDDRERNQWAALQQIREGVRRTIAETQTIRRVRPISDLEVRDMIEMMRPDILTDSRDAAILAVGFGGCRRRSEVVSLDYLERGKTKGSKGYITVDDKAAVLHIQSSKTNKTGKEEQYPIYRQHARILVQAIEEWIKVSKPKPGEPLFKAIQGKRGTAHSSRPQSGYKDVYWVETPQGKGNWYARYKADDGKRTLLGIFEDAREAHLALCKKTGEAPRDPFDLSTFLGGRLGSAMVAKVVKARYRQLKRQKYGKKLTPEQEVALDAAADEVSGHSMRAGYITTAATHGHDANVIRIQSGHASTAMVTDNYIRIQVNEKTSSQKGMRLS